MESITNKQVYDTYASQTGDVEQKASSTYAILSELCAEHNVCWNYREGL